MTKPGPKDWDRNERPGIHGVVAEDNRRETDRAHSTHVMIEEVERWRRSRHLVPTATNAPSASSQALVNGDK